MSSWRNLVIAAAFFLLSIPSFAQKKTEQVDSLVNLLSAQSMELIEKYGTNYRKVTGPARFLHNNTYLICDTALWNVNRGEIEAWGNVKILQNQTVLTSEKLTYIIDDDLAQFRGSLVQLEDKDRNTLRTRFLDYNTKDSVAVFRNGGSMKDKDGQIIESMNGTYDSKAKLFTFTDNVNMFTDSVFVKTTRIDYHTDRDYATFGRSTDAWKDDDMLSAEAGWYDRRQELFFFRDRVHTMTNEQEAWSDSLYFWRNTMDVEMLGNVQVTDTTRKSSALAGRIQYLDSLSQVTLTRNPAIIAVTDSTNTPKDTVYLASDLIRLRSFRKCDIDESEFTNATKRLADINSDAVGAYRKQAYEEALKAAEDAKKKDADYQIEQKAKEARESRSRNGQGNGGNPQPVDEPASEPPSGQAAGRGGEPPQPPVNDSLPVAGDSLAVGRDSLLAGRDSLMVSRDSLMAGRDSLGVVSDSLGTQLNGGIMDIEEPKDTTKVSFIDAVGKVRLYREDFQMRCDSLKFNELDSLVRLHRDPKVWNEGNRQYVSDSIYVSFGQNNLDRAYLMSNAFVTVEEAPECYDQIRSTEMLAFFDEEGLLRRFDALGGADAIFYLKEDSLFATVNKSQAKLLSALFKDGELEGVSYFQEVKNDASPLAQMRSDDRHLRGFVWNPEMRPAGPQDITDRTLRPTQRRSYSARPKARFHQTDIYFPGYMSGVYKKIAEDERKAREREAARNAAKESAGEEAPVEDAVAEDASGSQDGESAGNASSGGDGDKGGKTLLPGGLPGGEKKAGTDSLGVAGGLGVADSLGVAGTDSLGVAVADSTAAPALSEKELKREAQAKAKALKQAEKEAKWARLDSLDAAKAAAKADAKAAKERQRKIKVLKARDAQEKKDAARLEKYRLRYEQRNQKKLATEKKPKLKPVKD